MSARKKKTISRIACHLVSEPPPNGSTRLVSAGPAINPGSSEMVIATYRDGVWTPLFTTGSYCGAKYWWDLPSLPEPITLP